MKVAPIAVVGASLAGLTAVQALTESPAVTAVTVFGDEPHPPYDRPPLSKEVLRGVWDVGRCALKPVEDPRVTWRTGVTVTGLDQDGPRLRLAGGTAESFPGGVLIATGATPRTIAGADLDGVHVLRSLDDALGLNADLDRLPGRVVVAGGGFIGAEVAAACVERGLNVTVLEAQDAPFERVLGAEVGEAVMAEHRARGVQIRTAAAVAALHGPGRVESVELADGSHLPADVVVLGLGVTPCVEWLTGSGLTIDNGVVCDASLAAAPRIVAAGDVARWPNHRFGEFRRVEHWDNAIRQGRHAALRLLAEHGYAEKQDFTTVPWVWSDQYANKLQVVGSTVDFAEVVVAHGTTAEQRFVALYRRGEHLVAAVGFNNARLVTRYRRLLARPVRWNDALAYAASGAGPASTRPGDH
ncbi:NADPH-dependent 2,4-dienoyl-CoA reductase/sulfur reductase-like enzyme [Actinoplanes lutulentus]|uniref:NAD/ferredoxin-dependent reductase-like protein n=1 Tax=Actinoplanes lutulentus TaxID=1287878 RepID=A0A327Z2Y2_9ACTN|nr:FAD-dependent oxidoreductase [Actinoplanes lutulentus]MBB2943319.1 NADPH-dependent 2,4-dienoyl-CoA reductase/sulfur reductase-like enzyme [Actinoplanes lutulentus]RAK28378.1 NAD/ferredoxin-dependent reductase-like protein [Actinoplanes lutulentus]